MNNGALISSIFGRGTVYENLDRVEEIPEFDEDEEPPHSILVQPSAKKKNSRRTSRSADGNGSGNSDPGVNGHDNGATHENAFSSNSNVAHRSETVHFDQVSHPRDFEGEYDREYRSHASHHEDDTGGTNNNIAQNILLDPTERALWMWANVDNLDVFLQQVYSYFLGNGMYCILLTRALNMATILFVVGFSTYLSQCINYSMISSSSSLDQVTVPHCMAQMPIFNKFVLWLFALFWFLKVFQYVGDIKRLNDLKNFHQYLLGISENDMQTISWQEVVNRMSLLKDKNLATAAKPVKLDAHAIANRIMRKENYLIAMISRDILDLDLPMPSFPIPLPFFNGSRSGDVQEDKNKKKTFFSRTLEWALSLCIMDFVFNDQGQVRSIFLRESERRTLAAGLRRRFQFFGVMTMIFAPFIILYMTIHYFFRYFNQYHRDPSAIGSRQYTPLAQWKMREFNELYHLFQERLKMSYPMAGRYINQFPREKTVSLLKFVSFVAGSFAAVLGFISLVDPELFLGFEITKDRTVLFYISIFGSILAVSRSMVPEESFVFDPETAMRMVAEYTHYMPKYWENNLHSDAVKVEFAAMYDLQILIILRELVSVIVTPFVLYFSLARSCDKIVDFFREYSVHVDGLGYVCVYATFDFDRKQEQPSKNKTHAKMLKSYLNFMDNYGDPKYRKQAQRQAQTSAFTSQSQHVGMAPGTGHHSYHFDPSRPNVPTAAPIDMTSSIMAKFNRINSGGADIHSVYWKPLEEQSFEASADPDVPANTVDDNNPGVLGLLNQFYKGTDQRRGL